MTKIYILLRRLRAFPFTLALPRKIACRPAFTWERLFPNLALLQRWKAICLSPKARNLLSSLMLPRPKRANKIARLFRQRALSICMMLQVWSPSISGSPSLFMARQFSIWHQMPPMPANIPARRSNPNAAIVAALIDNGTRIIICGQSAAAQQNQEGRVPARRRNGAIGNDGTCAVAAAGLYAQSVLGSGLHIAIKCDVFFCEGRSGGKCAPYRHDSCLRRRTRAEG